MECIKKTQTLDAKLGKKIQVKHDQNNSKNAGFPCVSEPKTISSSIDPVLPRFMQSHLSSTIKNNANQSYGLILNYSERVTRTFIHPVRN